MVLPRLTLLAQLAFACVLFVRARAQHADGAVAAAAANATPEPSAWAPQATPQPPTWTPEPVAATPEPPKWTPQATPEPVVSTPEPPKWTPQATPEPVASTPEPPKWTPQATPEPVASTPEPSKWTPQATPEPATTTPEPVAVQVEQTSEPAAAQVRFTDDGWQRLENYPMQLLESAGGMLHANDGRKLLMVAGGYIDNSALLTTKEAYVLDVQKKNAQWQRVADMPRHLTHCAQTIVGDRLYLCGGFLSKAPGRSVGQCYVFSYSDNEWVTLPKLPLAVGGGGMVFVSQRNSLLFSSGMIRRQDEWDGEDSKHTYMLKLDELDAGWKRMADIPVARNHMSALSVRGRYLFVGGQRRADEDHGNQRFVHEYDVEADAWIERAPLPKPLGHIAASTLRYGGGALVVAGITNGRQPLGDVLFYDLNADSWRQLGQFPRSVQSTVCGLANGKLVCTTGRGHPGEADETHARSLSRA